MLANRHHGRAHPGGTISAKDVSELQRLFLEVGLSRNRGTISPAARIVRALIAGQGKDRAAKIIREFWQDQNAEYWREGGGVQFTRYLRYRCLLK